MEDVLDVYQRAYDKNYPVVCMDESSKQLHKNKLPIIPAKPGVIEKFDTGYERNGTSNIFMSFEPLTGKRYVEISERRTRIDWARHIKNLVDKHYVDAIKIILVLDNLNIHTGASLYELFEPAEAKRILDKIEFHYTPKHGSWLNMAEIELSHLFRQCVNQRIETQEQLTDMVQTWMGNRNQNSTVVNWQFSTEDARIKLKRLYPTIVTIDDKFNETE